VYWLGSQDISLCFKKYPSYTLISSHMNYWMIMMIVHLCHYHIS
jgi:hypothetical protein